jgi:homogentisate 1,2-dioxygenase
VKVSYHHAKVDSDEVLFYADREFMSRRGAGIRAGSLTLHPTGFVHGQQPGRVGAAVDASRTDETAVMIDSFAPLQISAAGRALADAGYPWSWARPVS